MKIDVYSHRVIKTRGIFSHDIRTPYWESSAHFGLIYRIGKGSDQIAAEKQAIDRLKAVLAMSEVSRRVVDI